jgi:hypothetical protein
MACDYCGDSGRLAWGRVECPKIVPCPACGNTAPVTQRTLTDEEIEMLEDVELEDA